MEDRSVLLLHIPLALMHAGRHRGNRCAVAGNVGHIPIVFRVIPHEGDLFGDVMLRPHQAGDNILCQIGSLGGGSKGGMIHVKSRVNDGDGRARPCIIRQVAGDFLRPIPGIPIEDPLAQALIG